MHPSPATLRRSTCMAQGLSTAVQKSNWSRWNGPLFRGDQVANAHRVEQLGAGVRMNAANLSVDAVRSAVQSLGDARIVARSADFARALEAYRDLHAAADAVLGRPPSHRGSSQGGHGMSVEVLPIHKRSLMG